MNCEDEVPECLAVEDLEAEDDADMIEDSPERPQVDGHYDDCEDGCDDEVDDGMRGGFVVRHRGIDDGDMMGSLISRSQEREENDPLESFLKRPRICMDGMGSSCGRELMVYDESVDSIVPYEGMEFESEEDAKIFYNSYARRIGFSIRVSIYSRSKRDGLIISRRFVCSKEGFRRNQNGAMHGSEGKTKRPRAVTREGCKAMIVVKKQSSGKWVLSKFVEGHSHPLAPPGKVHCLRSHKGDKDKAIRELTHELERANERCAVYRSHLLTVLRDVEELLLRKVEGIRQTRREIEREEQCSLTEITKRY